MRGEFTAAVAVVMLTVCAAPAVGGVIEPQHGIAGVRLGMTEAQVSSAAGPPLRITRGTGELGPFTSFAYRGLTVGFHAGARVTSITTRSSAHRTRSGVGVGSSEALVLRRIRGVVCRAVGAQRTCTLGVESAGRTITRFEITRGRVWMVAVGVLID